MVPSARSITSPQAWACEAAPQTVRARAADVFLLEAFIAVLLEQMGRGRRRRMGRSGVRLASTFVPAQATKPRGCSIGIAARHGGLFRRTPRNPGLIAAGADGYRAWRY